MPVIPTKGHLLFPELAAFIDAYFHQDFDTNGDTLEDVLAPSVADSDAHLRGLFIGDVDGFLGAGETGMDAHFREHIRPDIIAAGLRPTTCESCRQFVGS